MNTKFIFSRSYVFRSEKGRRRIFFFHLTARHAGRATFFLRDKGNTEVVEADVRVDDDIEKACFLCKGVEIELRADQYIPKGFKGPLLPEAEFREWAKTREEVLRDAHLYSSRHRREMLASKECGCYCCQRIFPADEVEVYVDDSDTAVCPYCGTDAVIPAVPGIVKVSPELLKALNEKYF